MARKTIKLFAPDKNGLLCYQGECKILIDQKYSKALHIEPKNKEFVDICAFFRWKFIQKKNLLFVFAELEVQDFVLIFANEEMVEKVVNVIFRFKEEEQGYIQEEEIRKRLIIPMFQRLPQNHSTRFKRAIINWIEQHEDEEKKELIKLYKKQKRNIQIMDIKNVKQEASARNVRKRRFSEMISNNNVASNEGSIMVDLNSVNRADEIESAVHSPVVFDESLYKIVAAKYQNKIRRKLLIFTSVTKSHCYEYNFYSKKGLFYHKCGQNKSPLSIALLEIGEDGKECIKLQDKPHLCAPLNYDDKKYIEMKTVKKPDYKLLNYCTNTTSKKILIIFDSNEKTQCFEYSFNAFNMKFQCRGCAKKGKCIAAEIVHEDTNDEYIRLMNDEHVCEIRIYDAQKYPESYNYVLSPNFEIQTEVKDGIERQTLIIFNGNDRKMCYIYHLRTYFNCFCCTGCEKNKKLVSAKIHKNSNGEDYVILSNVKHVCSPKEHIPQEVIRAPKMKIIEGNGKLKSKIIIFASDDNELCYCYSKSYEHNSKRYYCIGCKKLSKYNCFAYLCKQSEIGEGEYYVKMMKNHICQPQKYEPEKYETKILKPSEDYVFLEKKDKKASVAALVIYDSNDKSLCYQFDYQKSQKLYQCSACKKKKTCFPAKVVQNSDGTENIIISTQNKHVCDSIAVSSIITSDTVLLERRGLPVTEEKPKKNFGTSSNFMVFNRNDEKKTKLVIFSTSTKEFCYEYSFVPSEKLFRCCSCNVLKKSFRAQLIKETNTEEYVKILTDTHVCTPKKFVLEEFQPKIIPESGFKVCSGSRGKPNSRLILFDNEKDGFCYKYKLRNYKKYHCIACEEKNKCVTAELCEKEDGQKYLEISAENHICESKKYEYEMIKFGNFVLQNNISGARNSIITIFNENDKTFGYQFSLKQKYFQCLRCKTNLYEMNIDKEGTQYLERNKNHDCSIQNLKENNLVFDDFQFEQNGNILIANHPNINDKFYKFEYIYEVGGFCCIKCKKGKNKFITATVCNGNAGKEFWVLNNKHFCNAFSK